MADEELPLYIPAPSLADYFVCPICMIQLTDCYMTTCGHRFCGKCIKESVDVHHRCPCCNAALGEDKLIKDRLFDEMIGKFNKEKTRAEKTYFNNLIDQTHAQDEKKTFTEIEVVLKDHLKRSLTAHQNYFQSIQKAYNRNCGLLKNKHSDQLEQLKTEGLTHTEQENESTLLQEKFDQEKDELANEFETSTKLIAKAYDRYLNEHIPDLSILPVRVNVTLLEKNVNLKLIEVKPLDTLKEIKKRIEASMEKRGDKIIKFGSDAKFLDFGLFSKRTVDEMTQIATQTATAEDFPEGVALISNDTRPVIELHMKSGSEVAISGTVYCESDRPKNCFAATFQPGQNEAMDYFTCQDCGFNWVCRPCRDTCHKGHAFIPYIMNHKPTWPCCYCPRKKKCRIQTNSQTDS